MYKKKCEYGWRTQSLEVLDKEYKKESYKLEFAQLADCFELHQTYKNFLNNGVAVVNVVRWVQITKIIRLEKLFRRMLYVRV